ncbi:XRE family transcriptional regulator [bacterium]|nr:XRE family transcriptional regulator [bacterium]
MRNEIGERLRAARAQARLTQKQVSETLGINPSSIYTWERGETMPAFDKAIQLAHLYGMTVSELAGDDQTASDRFARLEERLDRIERGK